MLVCPLTASSYERDARNDRPGWANFLARPSGSLSLRFYIQPTMASLLALRAGIQEWEAGPARLSVGDTGGLAGSNDSVLFGAYARLRLSAHDDSVRLSPR